ncbi:2-dehydropantoate 2-reductase (Ketopantoate reductase) (KPA reductase) (KPR) [Vermiconidia calcicola]|uniref:2-dehydropantoate 2-reductase (Ketopantoate reductase) (KPA reductase) (KPR) n=1 Tax=Vermiconidia calcicola TaxID=1690605 RepID=A0ACC3MRV8_9PEZI|nr:2-dehydropantoate 2-reductase (Ketopantoate reductase) (KPA reductase) (KPR) [Vermiconidia calcicola]
MDSRGGCSPFQDESAREERSEANTRQAQHEPAQQQQQRQDERTDYGGFRSDEEGLSAMDRQYAKPTPDLPRRIHIIGTGSIGKLVAHSLRGIANPPPITLIFHRYRLLKAWEEGKKQITIQDDGYDVAREGFEVELMPEVRREHRVELRDGTPSAYDVATDDQQQQQSEGQAEQQQDEPSTSTYAPIRSGTGGPGDHAISTDPIHNLIVSTKGPLTIPALSAIKHRLTPKSTICFLQNGMGIIDDVNKQLFPNPAERPNYMQGIITHGANVPPQKAEEDPFYAVHAGHGTIALGLMPREDVQGNEKWAPSSRYLLRTLTRSPVLCAVGFTPTELLQQQLEKLVANCILNPLTSLLDNRNGALLYNFPLTRTMRLMLAEISHVIRSLPELANVPNVSTRFSPERLETLCVSIADKTKDNISSMLADVRAGKKTEIEYINGYIVRRGEEIGIKCVVNYAIMQTVIGKAAMIGKDRRGEVPVEERSINPD